MQNSDVSQDFSSIKKLEKIVHLSLPITFVSNEKAGIVEVLDSWIRQYNHQLGGILVSYSNVSLISLRNTVICDKLYILVNVKANFDLFCPNVGDIVKGKINRISKEHIGCLMHDAINVVIRLTEYYPEELNKFIRIDHDILFEITHFDCKPKEIRVKGKITPHCLEVMNESFPVVEDEYLTNMSFTNQNNVTRYDFDDIFASHQSDDNINCTSVASHIVKSETMFGVDDINHDSSTMNGANDLSSLGSDASGINVHKEKKSKKRKRDDSDTSLNPEKKSKKRKKHSNVDTTLIPEKKSKKRKKESASDEQQSVPTCTNEMSEDTSPQKKKFKNHERDPSSNETHKKKKKDKKTKKKDHSSSKKNKIVASGSVFKADKKNKKKHSKKEGNKKKDKSKKKSKHKTEALDDVKIKSEN